MKRMRHWDLLRREVDSLEPAIARHWTMLGLTLAALAVTIGIGVRFGGDPVALGTFRTDSLIVGSTVQIGGTPPSGSQRAFFTDNSATDTTMWWTESDSVHHVGTGGNNEMIHFVSRMNDTFDTTAGAANGAIHDEIANCGVDTGTNDVTCSVHNVNATCSTGHCAAFVWNSQQGIMRNDGPVQFGGPSGTSSVQLGQTVQRFTVMPTSPTTTIPQLDIGVQAAVDGAEMHIKNTATATAGVSIEMEADTTVNANTSGQLVFYRGAGGGQGGSVFSLLCEDSGVGSCLAGSSANDFVIANYTSGKSVRIAANTGSVVIGTTAANTATFDASGNTTLAGFLDMASHLVKNVTDPVSAQDAATKNYVDNHGGNVVDVAYGDGLDGSVTFDGSTTILGMAPASSTYTMTRDIFLTSATVNTGVKIITNGWRLYATGTLTLSGTANINNDGGNASANTAGTGGGGGSTRIYLAGANGGAGANGVGSGTAGGSSSAGLPRYFLTHGTTAAGSDGAATGMGGGGGDTGQTSGDITVTAAPCQSGFHELNIGHCQSAGSSGASQWSTCSGGGGGSSNGSTGTGGGGGGCGGVAFVAARKLAGSGTITSKGGNGGNGVAGNSSHTGGGGGGGGGLVILVYDTNTGTVTTSTAGGTKGTPTGTGTTAGNGFAGAVIKYNLSGDGT